MHCYGLLPLCCFKLSLCNFKLYFCNFKLSLCIFKLSLCNFKLSFCNFKLDTIAKCLGSVDSSESNGGMLLISLGFPPHTQTVTTVIDVYNSRTLSASFTLMLTFQGEPY